MAAEDYIPSFGYEHALEPIEYYADDFEIVRQTEKAVLFEIDGVEIWLPRSQIRVFQDKASKRDDSLIIVASAWIAEKRPNVWKMRGGVIDA